MHRAAVTSAAILLGMMSLAALPVAAINFKVGFMGPYAPPAPQVATDASCPTCAGAFLAAVARVNADPTTYLGDAGHQLVPVMVGSNASLAERSFILD